MSGEYESRRRGAMATCAPPSQRRCTSGSWAAAANVAKWGPSHSFLVGFGDWVFAGPEGSRHLNLRGVLPLVIRPATVHNVQ